MPNPFEKRVTEYIQDDHAFLNVVSPEPLIDFFSDKAAKGILYDRLVIVVGAPGSGKTTLATLLQFKTLNALLTNRQLESRAEIISALTDCQVIVDGSPAILACRLPMEEGYREFWQLPYDSHLRMQLLFKFIQARAVLSWLRNIEAAGYRREQIAIQSREGAGAALEAIGGETGVGLFERARAIERGVYTIVAALLSPQLGDMPGEAIEPYAPFDVVQSITIQNDDGHKIHLHPLVILDDAHFLHPDQFKLLRERIAAREMKIARWLVTRFDALTPEEIITGTERARDISLSEAGIQPNREITFVWFQAASGSRERNERHDQRDAFRKMAKSMSSRYLKVMPIFAKWQIQNLSEFMADNPEAISRGNIAKLKEKALQSADNFGIPEQRVTVLLKEVDRYLAIRKDVNGEDIRWAMAHILIHRYANRVPQHDLFESAASKDLEPPTPIIAKSSVLDGARIHLLHEYGRPYYYGVDTLCDSSDQNAELFLRLANALVGAAEARLIGKRSATLRAGEQHKILVNTAESAIRQWDFPELTSIANLAAAIAKQCVTKSLEPNASLGGGANAIGIPQQEFDDIHRTRPELARVLQHAIGYNVISVVPRHSTKNALWCLLELGGFSKLAHGLTLRRGGFLERKVADLDKYIREGAQ